MRLHDEPRQEQRLSLGRYLCIYGRVSTMRPIIDFGVEPRCNIAIR